MRIRSIRGDADDPFSRGHLCPKAVALEDLHEDPDRLRTRCGAAATAGRRIGWDEALDEVARPRSPTIQRAHGRDAVGALPRQPDGPQLRGDALRRSPSSQRARARATASRRPRSTSCRTCSRRCQMFGHQLLAPDPGRRPHAVLPRPRRQPARLERQPDDRARHAAPARGAPRARRAVSWSSTRGAPRPRSSPTSTSSSGRAPTRSCCSRCCTPSSRRGSSARAASPTFTDGLERAARDRGRALRRPSGSRAATGIAAGRDPRAGARLRGRAVGGVPTGASASPRRSSAALAAWLVNVAQRRHRQPRPRRRRACSPRRRSTSSALGAQAARGHFGRPRAACAGCPSSAASCRWRRWPRRSRPPATGRSAALVTFAGNPVLSTPNGARLDRALAGARLHGRDRHLPERDHAPRAPHPAAHLRARARPLRPRLPRAGGAQHRPLRRRPLLPPPPGARHDWEILLELARRLQAPAAARPLGSRRPARGSRRLGPAAAARPRAAPGPYGRARRAGCRSSSCERQPHGIDLGPLEPRLPERLLHARQAHRSSRPRSSSADLARLERALLDARRPRRRRARCSLIGRRELRSNNSWMHNSQRLVKGPDALHAAHAPRRRRARAGSPTASACAVRSRVGEVAVPLEVTDEMMPRRGQPAARLGPRPARACSCASPRRHAGVERQRPHRRPRRRRAARERRLQRRAGARHGGLSRQDVRSRTASRRRPPAARARRASAPARPRPRPSRLARGSR